jgi:hypothetical protein
LVLPDHGIKRIHAEDMPLDAPLMQLIGHGGVATGWITFPLAQDFLPAEKLFATMSSIEGSLRCRDYLDQLSELTFSLKPD